MRALLVAAGVVAGVLAAGPARAQTAAIDAQQFHPPATSNGFISVDGGFTAPHLGFSAGLSLTYDHDPLVLRVPSTGALTTNGELIKYQLGMDLQASFAVLNRLELGVDLPFVPSQSFASTSAFPNLAAAALGDLRVDLKGVLWAPRAHDHRFALTAIAGLVAPTGDANSFDSEHALAGRFRLVGEWRARWARVGLEVGGVVQPARDYNDLHVGSQFSYGVAAAVPLPLGFGVVGEIAGLVGLTHQQNLGLTASQAPAEGNVGVTWRARFGLELLAAGGSGLTHGYGSPEGRFIFAIRYTTPEKSRDRMPVTVSFDHDGDGVPDNEDKCPSLAGTPENNGCPTQAAPDVDSDGDGVPDRADACPDKPGLPSNGGCPLSDVDGDGVPDAEDRCPEKPGPKENQGCPDFDSDGDGFVDRLDKCPFDPEVFNGVQDDDGCPDQPAGLATFNGNRIAIAEPILFERDGNVVDKRSYKLLGIIAHIIRLHPEILKLRIEGHTDNKGAPLDLLDLSRQRAAAVRRWLIENGKIEARRLVAEGFGADKPIADNRDFVGRAKNRRIEFVVVQKLNDMP